MVFLRDSYLLWPPVETDFLAPDKDGPATPAPFDKATQRLWPFHVTLRMALAYVGNIPETAAKPGAPLPLAKYTLEIGRGPARGDSAGKDAATSAPGGGLAVNEIPPPLDSKSAKPSPLAAFLAVNAPATDPHGWGILDRMGLAVTFRIRTRQTGEYVQGNALAELVRHALLTLQAKAFCASGNRADGTPLRPGDAIAFSIKANGNDVFYLLGTQAPAGNTLDGLERIAMTDGELVTLEKERSAVVLSPGVPVLYVWGDATLTEISPPSFKLTPRFKAKPDSDKYFDQIRQILAHLNVEFLIQSGSTTTLGVNDHASGESVPASALLALARLSLRPTVKQRMAYQSMTVRGPASTPVLFTVSRKTSDTSFLVKTGTPADPISLVAQKTAQASVLMPKNGSFELLLRANKIDTDHDLADVALPTPTESRLEPGVKFGPDDWRSAYFTVPPEAALGIRRQSAADSTARRIL